MKVGKTRRNSKSSNNSKSYNLDKKQLENVSIQWETVLRKQGFSNYEILQKVTDGKFKKYLKSYIEKSNNQKE